MGHVAFHYFCNQIAHNTGYLTHSGGLGLSFGNLQKMASVVLAKRASEMS